MIATAVDLVADVLVSGTIDLAAWRLARSLRRVRASRIEHMTAASTDDDGVDVRPMVQQGSAVLVLQVLGACLLFAVGILVLALVQSSVSGPSWAETMGIWLVVAGAAIPAVAAQLLDARQRVQELRGRGK